MSENKDIKIAVIGLGAQGLVAMKNLLEEGFDVTGFDQNDYVGGIWHYSTEARVSVMPTTIVNVSKERACFTDFPYPDECGTYPTSAEIDQYLNDYCDHFRLRSHVRLGTQTQAVSRDDAAGKWILHVKSKDFAKSRLHSFDKLVIAIGPHSTPIQPVLQGQEQFKGKILHSIAFKDHLKFKDKKVMIVGASNTAADTCTSLIGIASKIYFSHRNTSMVVPRYLKNGSVLDHGMNYRMVQAFGLLEQYFPGAVSKFMESMVNKIIRDEFGRLDPAWKLSPAPSMRHQVPTVSDTLIPALRASTVTSTTAPRRVIGDHNVELDDGGIVKVDAIIFCTGYNPNFGILGNLDPTLTSEGTHDHYTPRLYQNIFSLEHPDSLAFVGMSIIFAPAFLMTDLSSMALAQIWSTKATSPSLPSLAEMHAWHLRHVRWVSSVRATHPTGKMVKFSLPDGPWLEWIQKTIRANIQENLGWTSLKAWRFWWNDRKFYNLLLTGIFSPVFYRLFDSDRRKKWDGAREAIERMNERAIQTIETRRRAALF